MDQLMVPCLYWHNGCVLRYYLHNDVSHACRCHWEQSRLLRRASVSFHALLSMNDTGLAFPGRARRDDRTSGGRAKLESSFLPDRRLAVRLNATARIYRTMRGRTRELGGAARLRTLKYVFASFGSTTALERTMSRYRCSKPRLGLGRAPLNLTLDQRRSWLVARSQAGAVILASWCWKCCSKSALGEHCCSKFSLDVCCCSCKHRWRVMASIALTVMP